MKVLVVDDEQDIRLIAQVALRAAGIHVQTAHSGQAGILTAREMRPDVILLDVMMPEMDGYGTFAALQADGDTASIPVIFLTAKTLDLSGGQPHIEGAAGYIPKPFSPRELPGQILEILERLAEG